MKAVRDLNGQWWRVVRECARCGKCCRDAGMHWLLTDAQGGCDFLIENEDGTASCGMGANMPFGCCIKIPGKSPDYCKVELEKFDLELNI